MGSDCRQIDWDKPLRSTTNQYKVELLRKISCDKYAILSHRQGHNPISMVVDAQGHLLHGISNYMGAYPKDVGFHYVENVPEEPRDHIVLCCEGHGALWGKSNSYPEHYTKKQAEEYASHYYGNSSRKGLAVKVPI